MTRKLTPKQSYILRHIARHGETSEHAVARNLESKGLLTIAYKRDRTEWNRTLNQMSVCPLTPEGETVSEEDEIKNKAKDYASC